MKINQQTSNLELSKKLEKLGMKQESHWYWESYYLPEITRDRHNNIIDSKYIRYIGDKRPVIRSGFLTSKLKYYSAFTVAELGEMLPMKIETVDDEGWIYMSKAGNGYTVGYGFAQGQGITWLHGLLFDADTEADARAKMLIYLLENKLITL